MRFATGIVPYGALNGNDLFRVLASEFILTDKRTYTRESISFDFVHQYHKRDADPLKKTELHCIVS